MSLHAHTFHTNLRRLLTASFLLLLTLAAAAARAQPAAQTAPAAQQTAPAQTAAPQSTPTPAPTPYEITVGAVKLYRGERDAKVVAGLDDEIIVTVNNLQEEMRRQELVKEPVASRIDPNRLVLFLDDVEMKKLYPEAVIPSSNEVR